MGWAVVPVDAFPDDAGTNAGVLCWDGSEMLSCTVAVMTE